MLPLLLLSVSLASPPPTVKATTMEKSSIKDWGKKRPVLENQEGPDDCWVYDCCLMANPLIHSSEQYSASSTLGQQGAYTYTMKNLGDDNPQTAWVEGAKGHGIGEYIEFSETALSGPYDGKTHFSILNGLQSRKSSWKNNSRVKEMDVLINGSPVARVVLLDSMGIQDFSIPYPKLEHGKLATVRFQIVSVYPGAKYEDTAIAEIYQCGG